MRSYCNNFPSESKKKLLHFFAPEFSLPFQIFHNIPWDALRELVVEEGEARGNPVPFYTAAELSRSAYSKIMSFPDRHPSKETVLAMAAALKMPLADAESLLRLAGYALSDSIPSDLVWSACFAGGVHHLPQIRQLLAEFAGR